jgi:putative lipoprotein
MWRLLLFLGTTCSAFSIIACQSDDGQSKSKPEDALKSFLQRYVKENGITDSTTRYADAFVDLNGDGMKEAIVYLVGRWWCGTGGCPTLVLTPEASSYRLVTKILVTRAPIRVLPTRSHGWRTLTALVQGGGVQPGYEAELAFDGESYPTSAANPPARPLVKRVEGEVVLPASANDITRSKPLYP